jgi:hypothetical protein
VVFAIEPVQKSCDCLEGKGIMLDLAAQKASLFSPEASSAQPWRAGPILKFLKEDGVQWKMRSS